MSDRCRFWTATMLQEAQAVFAGKAQDNGSAGVLHVSFTSLLAEAKNELDENKLRASWPYA